MPDGACPGEIEEEKGNLPGEARSSVKEAEREELWRLGEGRRLCCEEGSCRGGSARGGEGGGERGRGARGGEKRREGVEAQRRRRVGGCQGGSAGGGQEEEEKEGAQQREGRRGREGGGANAPSGGGQANRRLPLHAETKEREQRRSRVKSILLPSI